MEPSRILFFPPSHYTLIEFNDPRRLHRYHTQLHINDLEIKKWFSCPAPIQCCGSGSGIKIPDHISGNFLSGLNSQYSVADLDTGPGAFLPWIRDSKMRIRDPQHWRNMIQNPDQLTIRTQCCPYHFLLTVGESAYDEQSVQKVQGDPVRWHNVLTSWRKWETRPKVVINQSKDLHSPSPPLHSFPAVSRSNVYRRPFTSSALRTKEEQHSSIREL